MAEEKPTTYAALFERYLTRTVEPFVGVLLRSPDGYRGMFFDDFLRHCMFVCGVCGSEFTPEGIEDEHAAVRCGRCS